LATSKIQPRGIPYDLDTGLSIAIEFKRRFPWQRPRILYAPFHRRMHLCDIEDYIWEVYQRHMKDHRQRRQAHLLLTMQLWCEEQQDWCPELTFTEATTGFLMNIIWANRDKLRLFARYRT
jgi:hypothetical protein